MQINDVAQQNVFADDTEVHLISEQHYSQLSNVMKDWIRKTALRRMQNKFTQKSDLARERAIKAQRR